MPEYEYQMCEDNKCETEEPHWVVYHVESGVGIADCFEEQEAKTITEQMNTGVARQTQKEATMPEVKYPDVHVQLTGEDGNAFAIIGAVNKALRREVGDEAVREFEADIEECQSYDDLLGLCMRTVDVH